MREEFSPLVRLCKDLGRAVRIGTNHGSLSDRIMNRYGDTPLGMVESALEFARIARGLDFHDLVFSMKSSNPKVMVQAYRLLVARLQAEGPDWNYPLHLGVTEAGDGEDGRIKSAIGIGSLLADGIGDTIRVSLTEDAVCEVPVARRLVALAALRKDPSGPPPGPLTPPFDPFSHSRRPSARVTAAGHDTGAGNPVRVAVTPDHWRHLAPLIPTLGEFQPEIPAFPENILALDPRDDAAVAALNASPRDLLITVADGLPLPVIAAFRLLAARADVRHPILLKDSLENTPLPPQDALLSAATRIGSLLCDGIGDAVLVQSEADPTAAIRLAYNILQAAGTRIFKTDYVACPGCGRTLFNLQQTTQAIRAATGHLKGVRIAVMGCIVNGPGEMADADFGYVGGAPGKINLYVGKTPVEFNIPSPQAVGRLIELIRSHGKWLDPPENANP